MSTTTLTRTPTTTTAAAKAVSGSARAGAKLPTPTLPTADGTARSAPGRARVPAQTGRSLNGQSTVGTRTLRLSPPASVHAWRDMLAGEADVPTMSVVKAAVHCVRTGQNRAATEDATGMAPTALTALVVDLGSRCAQMNKRGPKIKTITRGLPGEPGSATRDEDTVTVIAATGWSGETAAPDIRRAYAALLASDDTLVKTALERWDAAHRGTHAISYTHIADLYSSSRGLLPELHLVIDHPTSVRAYLAAWQLLDDAAHAAMTGVSRLVSARTTPEQVRACLRDAFWLVPDAGALDRLAHAAGSPDPRRAKDATEALRRALSQLRAQVETRPARFMPRSLSDLTTSQVRAIAAVAGLHVDDGASSRSARSLEALAEDVEASRARVQAELTGI